jgi:hypothetical protein
VCAPAHGHLPRQLRAVEDARRHLHVPHRQGPTFVHFPAQRKHYFGMRWVKWAQSSLFSDVNGSQVEPKSGQVEARRLGS